MKVQEGILILEGQPTYIIDIINDDLVVGYDIDEKSLKRFHNEGDKDLSVLNKSNHMETLQKPKPKYTSKILKNIFKKSNILKKEYESAPTIVYEDPLFTSRVGMHTDSITGYLCTCFELKDIGNKPSGVFLSLDNIYMLDEKLDLSEWDGYNTQLYATVMGDARLW